MTSRPSLVITNESSAIILSRPLLLFTFPANPYHRLVKDYKLVRENRSDPLKDAQLALTRWSDQHQATQELQAKQPELLAAYHFPLGEEGLDSFFAAIRSAFAPPPDWFTLRPWRSPLVF